ncbi:MAG: hypothetical protein JO037_04740 [Actinobacteria bacterium]|nr:hypothetical protein [Actinomycetota bacterium]
MTGGDLIVVAPWIAFGFGLAVVGVLLLRARRGSRHGPRPFSAPAGPAFPPDRGRAGQGPAGRAHPEEARCAQHNGNGRPR